METHRSQNPLLSEYDDIVTIRKNTSVFNVDDGTVHLVYPESHPTRPLQEVRFDVAGYIVSFNLPGQGVPQRYVLRPLCLEH